VYKSLDPATGGEAFVLDSTNSLVRQLFGRGAAGGIEQYADKPLTVPTVTFPFSAYQLWPVVCTGHASTLWQRSAGQPLAVYTGDTGSAGQQGLALGAASTSGPSGYDFSHLLVSEVLWYSGELNTADRTAVLNYLSAKYAL